MMKKFGRFLGRILAEICLKIDYFGSKSPKFVNRCSPPAARPPFMLDD